MLLFLIFSILTTEIDNSLFVGYGWAASDIWSQKECSEDIAGIQFEGFGHFFSFSGNEEECSNPRKVSHELMSNFLHINFATECMKFCHFLLPEKKILLQMFEQQSYCCNCVTQKEVY